MQALPCRHSTKLMIFRDSHMPDAIYLLKTGRRRPSRLSHVAVQTGILLSIRRGWPLRGKAAGKTPRWGVGALGKHGTDI